MEADEKVCPRCAETIKAAAHICKYCRHEFAPISTTGQNSAQEKNTPLPAGIQKKKDATGCILVIAVLVLFVVAGKIFTSPGRNNSSTAATPEPSSSASATDASSAPPATPAPEPPLKVISWSCGEAESPEFIQTTGRVLNVSSEPLKNVTAVAEYYTKDGTFIKSDDAIIEFNPIMPGQASPFKTISTNNPLIKGCRISFKSLLGGAIDASMPEARKHK